MKKVTTGFVVQHYTGGKCTSQEFVAGGQVEWENEAGRIVQPPVMHEYFPFHMEQPQGHGAQE